MNISSLLNKIEFLKSKVDTLNKYNLKSRKEFINSIKIQFNYTSNKIEGNNTTLNQTKQIISDHILPKHLPLNDFFDIINYQNCIDLVFNSYELLTFNQRSIKSIHRKLLDSPSRSFENLSQAGVYKDLDNYTIRPNGHIHYYCSASNVPLELKKLLFDINKRLSMINVSSPDLHPISIATHFHYHFLNNIHPFSDGNGRLARLFMNLLLLKMDYPPILYREVDTIKYFETFYNSETPQMLQLHFMCERLIESLKDEHKFRSN